MSAGIGVNHIEGKAVLQKAKRNRQWPRIAPNTWERARFGRRGARLLPRPGNSEPSRLFAFIRGRVHSRFHAQLLEVSPSACATR